VEQIVHDPTRGIYATTDDYVHAMEVVSAKRLLFVAGTMGLDAKGEPPPSLDRQLELIWSNIKTILASADMTTGNIVRLTSYLTDRAYADANAAARIKALGDRRIPTTAIIVGTLDPRWLVEIEVVAAA
jgi:enamine deaminase RidA (YjgF/YER057c/UK114 family)